MKRLNLAGIVLGIMLIDACSGRPYASRPYRQGHHATIAGTKAQQKALKEANHFWF